MRDYANPLAERRRKAAYEKARYWNDPDARLRTINRARAWQGLAPRGSLTELDLARSGPRGWEL